MKRLHMECDPRAVEKRKELSVMVQRMIAHIRRDVHCSKEDAVRIIGDYLMDVVLKEIICNGVPLNLFDYMNEHFKKDYADCKGGCDKKLSTTCNNSWAFGFCESCAKKELVRRNEQPH